MHVINFREEQYYFTDLYLLNFTSMEKELQEIDFDNLYRTKIEGDCPYCNAHDFLMGSCELFALALSKKYGYQVYEIVQDDKMIHSFCIAIYKGVKLYIDVRGITSNYKEFLLGVRINKKNSFVIQKRNIEDDKLLKGEWDKEGYGFAVAIINNFPQYYTITVD